ncbi:hypothetical protein HCN44_006474 [Aphidius gifuensis]|uniref:Venom protein n=1 Tax=Aphidius gifuensis TaxID=684658 RepID=A0A834XZZ4_APHGI|nr:hypothetical protein HCN44_006474 [Aphidius gifuensis]
MYRKYFLLLLIVSNVIFSTASIAESAVEIIHLLSGISTVKFDYKNSINPAEKIAQFKNVNKKFEVVWTKIKELETNIYEVDTNIFIDYLSMTNYSIFYNEISDHLDRVEFLFDTCKRWSQKYMKQNQPLPIVEFTNDITSNKIFYPLSIISKIHKMFFVSKKKNVKTFLDTYHEALE